MTAWLIPTGEPRHLASRSHADVTRQSWLGVDGWYDYTYSPFVTYGHTHAGFKRRDYPAHRKNGKE